MNSARAKVEWRRALERWLSERSPQLGLRAGRLRIDELANPSGWHANVACTVSDGTTTLHVKLSGEREHIARTFALRDRLTARYHAPAILAWIDLGDLVGVCMPSVRGEPATERLLPALIGVADELHGDFELAETLPKQPSTMRQAFLELWIERLTANLNEIETA